MLTKDGKTEILVLDLKQMNWIRRGHDPDVPAMWRLRLAVALIAASCWGQTGPPYIIKTAAGGGGTDPTSGSPATAVVLQYPRAVAVDSAGNL